MNQDWLDQYKGVEHLKNKKERDWKFIIGMIVLLAIFAVMGGAFWNMVCLLYTSPSPRDS